MTRRAIELAAIGIGQVSPNPLVGCVVVDAEGNVAGEGTYVYKDVVHAEVIALEKAGERAKGGTAYVSLEPHSHQSRTPPCSEALINADIKRVVCPIEDPNPKVSGRGFERLREAGIEVVTGILADEAAKLNEKFIHWHKTGRPFVHLKSALSLDGRIATRAGDSQWITNEFSRKRSHELRHEYDAILIGANTAVMDNPALTDRSEKPRSRELVRVVLDNSLNLPSYSQLAANANKIPTLVFSNSQDAEKIAELESLGVEIIIIDEGGRNLAGVLHELAKRDIQSVLVEGGASVAGSFYDAKLIDKVTYFIAPLLIGGIEALPALGGQGAQSLNSAMRLDRVEISNREGDLEITGYPNWNE